MDNEELEIEKIKSYLDQNLTAEEREIFEKRLTTDQDFRKLFNEIETVLLGIKSYSRKENLKKLKNLEGTIRQKGKKSIYLGVSRQLRYWAAAAVFILLALTAVWVIQLGIPDTEALYTQYYQPYPNVFEPTVRGERDTVSLYLQAFAAYDQNDFAGATILFEQLLQEAKTDTLIEQDIILFYLGNSYLANNNVPQAIDNLAAVDNKSLLREQAQWYLALAHLKNNELDEAENVLQGLTNTSGVYKVKAETLLDEIQD